MVKKRKISRYLLYIFFIAALSYIIFNDSGLIKYLKLKRSFNDLNEQVEERIKQNNERKAELDSLEKKIPEKIEQTAREKYSMVKKGEKVIKVEEK